MMTGALMAGLFMDQLQLKWAFPFGAVVMVLGVVGFWFMTGRISPLSDMRDHPATPGS
jgi:hypothetical protein